MGDSIELTFDYPIPDADWDKIMDVEFENTKSITFRTKSGKTVEFAKVSEEFEWCHDCKEYDAERHCCPRWTKVIRKMVEEVRQGRPKGKWVKLHGYVTPGGDPVWCCSECGKEIHVYGIEHGSYGADIADHQWVACPNCGAMMEGEEDNGTD